MSREAAEKAILYKERQLKQVEIVKKEKKKLDKHLSSCPLGKNQRERIVKETILK